MKKAIVLVFYLIVSGTFLGNAQDSSDTITDKFFQIFEKEPLKALDYAFATNPYLLEDQLALETLKSKYAQAKGATGTYHGYSKITKKKIGESYKLVSFLVRYERFPLRFTFVLYRAKDTWRVNRLYYDDELLSELQASAKQDHI